MTYTVAVGGIGVGNAFARWRTEKRAQLRAAMLRAYTEQAAIIKRKLRANMRAAFKVRRPQFVNVMTTKIFAAKLDRLPDMQAGALRAAWVSIHETGGTIRGPLLIPMNLDKRVGRKTFRGIVDTLMRAGNAYFRTVNGSVILFAENIPENAKQLSRWKSSTRKKTGKTVKRGADVPIAVLVKKVTLRRRLAVRGTINAQLPALARSIQARMNFRES